MEVSLFTFHLCPPLLKSIDKNFLTTPNYYLILREWQKEKSLGFSFCVVFPHESSSFDLLRVNSLAGGRVVLVSSYWFSSPPVAAAAAGPKC
jgi:hypothetical protein